MISIIGYGNHVKKNVLPALERAGLIPKSIYIRRVESLLSDELKKYKFQDKFDDFINDASDFVYIATPISTHFYYAKLALQHKKNVICEKPLVEKTEELDELSKIAKKNGVKLFQVIMYRHHAAKKYLVDVIDSNKYGKLKEIKSKFKIPHLDLSDIRYNKDLGGGALLDVGFYPLSSIYIFLPNATLVSKEIRTRDGYQVDLSGKAHYSNGIINAYAEWGIGDSYVNEIEVKFEFANIRINRFFSKPHDLNLLVDITNKSGEKKIDFIKADDHFANMFLSIVVDENDAYEIGVLDYKIIAALETIKLTDVI